MYPSRAAPPRAAVAESLDYGRGDRDVLRDFAGTGAVPPAAGQLARSPHTARGSSAGNGNDCRARSGHRNVHRFARYQAGTPKNQLRKVGCRASLDDPAHTSAAHFDECFCSNLKARSANSGPSSYGADDRAWRDAFRSNFWPGPDPRCAGGGGPRSGRWQQLDSPGAVAGRYRRVEDPTGALPK